MRDERRRVLVVDGELVPREPTFRVIMITASRDHGRAAQALQQGAFSYLPTR
jgi:DNA-binding NtrC family response regulator